MTTDDAMDQVPELLRDTNAEIARLSRFIDDHRDDEISAFNMMSLLKRRERLEEQIEKAEHRPSGFLARMLLNPSAYGSAMIVAGAVSTAVALSSSSTGDLAIVTISALQIALSFALLLSHLRSH